LVLPSMEWELSFRADPDARRIADRHYNRQNPGTSNFTPPGRCLVLKTRGAVWSTSWPYPEYVLHEWAGAWVNSLFRRESGPKASILIRDAVAATRWHWPETPALGMVTFINRDKVKPKTDYGFCYLRAGFEICGETKGGLLALRLPPERMPEAQAPKDAQERLFG